MIVSLEYKKDLTKLLNEFKDTKRLYLYVEKKYMFNYLQSKYEQFKNIEDLSIELTFELSDSQAKLIKMPNIFYMSNLKNLKISGYLCELPTNICLLKNLEVLNLSYNNLVFLPDSIIRLKKLKTLKINYNKLIELPKGIFKMPNLEKIDLAYNRLKDLSGIFYIDYIPKLRKLNISGNNFEKLPMALFDFTNLVKLNLNHNKIRFISDSIYQLIDLKTLYVCDNKIHLIGDGLFGLTNLERLDLSLNCITHIPHNIHNLIKLKYLNFNSNYITYLNDNLYNLTNLEELDLGHNKFDSITNDIIKLQNLNEINLSFNENLEYISPNIINVRNAININIYNTPSLDLDYRIENYLRGDNITIYNDNENVHTTSMRKNVDKSIINLLKDEYMISKEQLQFEINGTGLFTEEDLGLLNYDINNINVYMYIDEEITINYYTLLTKIWGRIINSDEEFKLELLKRFKEEITDGLKLCFVGKISRAVNILCGFFEDININISDNEQIGNIISCHLKGRELNAELKEELLKILTDMNFSNELINTFLGVQSN